MGERETGKEREREGPHVLNYFLVLLVVSHRLEH